MLLILTRLERLSLLIVKSSYRLIANGNLLDQVDGTFRTLLFINCMLIIYFYLHLNQYEIKI